MTSSPCDEFTGSRSITELAPLLDEDESLVDLRPSTDHNIVFWTIRELTLWLSSALVPIYQQPVFFGIP